VPRQGIGNFCGTEACFERKARIRGRRERAELMRLRNVGLLGNRCRAAPV
jgi:hypothetical protein